MSVVVGKVTEDKIIIGADSIRVSGWGTQEKDRRAKLFRENGMVVGTAGGCAEASMFQLFCHTHKPESPTEMAIVRYFSEFLTWSKQHSPSATVDNEYLIIFDLTLIYFSKFFARIVPEYYAIGAGQDFALSALYLGNSVEKAVEAACELSIFCEQPINIMEVNK